MEDTKKEKREIRNPYTFSSLLCNFSTLPVKHSIHFFTFLLISYIFFFFPFCINFFFEVLFPPSNVTLSTGGYCSQAEAEKILNQITKRTNRGLCKLMKNASTSNVIDLTQDFSSSEDEKFVFPCGYLPA